MTDTQLQREREATDAAVHEFVSQYHVEDKTYPVIEQAAVQHGFQACRDFARSTQEAEVQRLRDALKNSNEVFERLLAGQRDCGDPDAECPMQDAHKECYDWEPAGALRINKAALDAAAGGRE